MTITRSHQQLHLHALKVTHLTGVGVKLAEKLQRCGVNTVQDLLFHLPFRYQDRTQVTPIIASIADDWIVCEGEIVQEEKRIIGRRAWNYLLRDHTGEINLCYFNYTPAIQDHLKIGVRVRCFGQVRLSSFGKQIIHPDCQLVTDTPEPIENNLTAIYPSTLGLGQKQIRKLIDQALRLLTEKGRLDDLLPESILRMRKLPDLATALHYLHKPPPDANVAELAHGAHPCQQRLAFEELLAYQCAMLRLRAQQQKLAAIPCANEHPIIKQFIANLPYALTGAQARVIQEVSADLALSVPMLRLVQGDVGAGKTVIAAIACLSAIASNRQAAMMAPTEILAEQHYRTFSNWFKPLGIEVAWLTGKLSQKEHQMMSEGLQKGSFQCVVGTHALFQEDVTFQQLGLIVIDEQHRFGVHQRLALRNKGVQGDSVPHQLIMTATPIPRTLAMTAYADLDYSVLDELPPGRTPVTTVVMSNSRRQEIIDKIATQIAQKRQCYWVCPLIEESEQLQCQAAEEAFALLTSTLPAMRIALLHGRMKSQEKEMTMQRFKAGEIDLLVATTVIEVGVDVPNATVMVIENAERLGLAQLHQLRGRVGRGHHDSFCILLYQAPLSRHGKARLHWMRTSNDGFLIAEQDLAIRGPGEVLGTRQTGLARLRVADLIRDAALIPHLKSVAQNLLQNHPAVVEPLVQRWLANQEAYGHV